MKKFVTVLLSLLLAASVLAGCGGGNKFVNPGENYDANIDMTDDDYNASMTLKVGVTAEPIERELIKEAAKGFQEIFPNVKIETDTISGVSYTQAVKQRHTAGNMPDLFFTSESESFEFISNGIFLNLQPYVKAQLAQDPAWKDQFVESALKLGQENFDGVQYFMPRSSDHVVIHLNMTEIRPALEDPDRPDKSVGVETIRNGWTWEEFLKVCANIRAYFDSHGKGAGYLIDHNFTWNPVMFSVLKSCGVSICDEQGKWTVNTPEMQSVITLVRELVEKRYIARYNGGGANYEQGYGAMLIHSSSSIARYADTLTELGKEYELVTFPVINGEQGVTGYGVPGYGIYAGIDAKKRDIAWQFLSYLCSPEGQDRLASKGMVTPSVRKDRQDPATSKWAEGYTQYNLAAATYATERDYSESFFVKFPSTQKNSLVAAVAKFMSDIMDYNVALTTPVKTASSCISALEKDLQKAAIPK